MPGGWGGGGSCSPETAVNIGYSCNMLYDAMKDIFVIQGDTTEEVQQELR